MYVFRVPLFTIWPSVFTLSPRENKKSLLEEGSIMASLNHNRVVKLLGVIMEDRDCSLIIELLPRGNLLVMLEKVSLRPV